VGNRNDGTATKLRASDGAVLGTFDLHGSGPYGVAFDGTNVWFAGDPYLNELRASDGAVVGLFQPASAATGIAFDGANMWVSELDLNGISKF
jgi:hypothetical protein